ncbi:MAG: hypothetical protein JNK82_42640 [Myxococcaceae bacterium]|nr:hypothetical protein [Myxococcaceae bacterium]
MKRFLVLSCLMLASLASASPSEAEAKEVIAKQLLAKLTAKEERTSKFSRAYIPPQVRRVRVTDDAVAKVDAKGGEFMTFAVDAHHGFGDDEPKADSKDWRKDAIVGCVYVATGEVYVKRKDAFIPGAQLYGKKAPAAAEHVCVAKAGEQVAAAK